MTIICQGKMEDLEVSVRRSGRKIIIVTDRPQVARAIKRKVVESLKDNAGEPVVGFHPEK